MGTSELMFKIRLQQAFVRSRGELEGIEDSQGAKRLEFRMAALIFLEKWPLAKIGVWAGFEAGG